MPAMTPNEFVALLARQHRVLDRAAGSLLRWTGSHQDEAPEAREGYVGFFRSWCFGHHHRLEEEVLFPLLVEAAEVPANAGPLAVLRLEHERQVTAIKTLAEALQGAATTAVVRSFVHAFWEHLDKERSVEFPEAARRLGRHGVTSVQLPTPPVEPPEEIMALIDRFPPADDPEVVRGDGCIMCSAFGGQCHGLETEWWSVWEWQHYRSLDEG